MAAITGNTGSFVGGVAVPQNVTRWSADWSRDDHDVTSFDNSSGFQDTLVGLHKLTGSAEGFLDSGATTVVDLTAMRADGVAFTLTASTGRTYAFSGVWTSWGPQSETGQPTRWSGTFESTGAITVA